MRRQAYLKFFKRRWKPTYQKSTLLRRVLERWSDREEQQERSRYQREFDRLKLCLDRWKLRVEEKHNMIKTYMALNHYKNTLLIKSFRAFHQMTRLKYGISALEDVVFSKLRFAMDSIRFHSHSEAERADIYR